MQLLIGSDVFPGRVLSQQTTHNFLYNLWLSLN